VPNAGPSDNGGWLQTSPDDTKLYHSVIGRRAGTLGKDDPGTVGGVFSLDISELVEAGDDYACNIDTKDEISNGGNEADCPTVVSTVPVGAGKTSGPHWGALDNFVTGDDGFYHETEQPKQLATADYFVARTGLTGDRRVCIVDEDEDGKLTVDTTFRDEQSGQPCINFNRKSWPHGAFGNAKPHSMLFVVADDDVR
jgi:hypothetical protein